MLQSLHISNYALIDHLDLELSTGFSVITGETGAGKSIILGALGLLQGNRADAKIVRSGARKCVVEGVFSTEGLGVRELLAAADIEDDANECILRREVAAGGKSRAFVNDTPVLLSTLKDICACLIDIHSQHQNLLLSHENFLLETLDAIAGNAALYKEYAGLYHQYTKAVHEHTLLLQKAKNDRSEQEFIEYQLLQLDEAQLQEGEQEELELECATLSHAEDIKRGLYTANGCIASEDDSISSRLHSAVSSLRNIAEFYSFATDLADRLDSVRIEIEDISGELNAATETVDFDPERLLLVNERLSQIYSLQKKHGVNSVAGLLEKADILHATLTAIENIDENIAQMEARVAQLFATLSEVGKQLTAERKKAATIIEKSLTTSLQHLGMPHVNLCIELSERKQPDVSGLDAVRFLFSANRQMPMQDVAQTASGGEIARLMLSLKALIAQKKKLPTIIFDEIDTGVSGTMAERMGQVMQQMGLSAQVVCITHLPQIAALGSVHYVVRKEEAEEGTKSHIFPLSKDERITELANMLSGSKITEAAINNARDLLSLQ